MEKNVYVLFNSDANVHKSSKILAKIEKHLIKRNIQHRTLISRSIAEGRSFIKQLEDNGGGLLILIGGDGTIHYAVNAITQFDKITVGFIRGGSGNDLCKTLRIKQDCIKALNDILDNPRTTMDLIDVGGIKCANLAATGLDIEVLRQRDRMKFFKGSLRYMLATIITLIRFGSYKLETEYDGISEKRNAFLMAVGNGKYFGGGIAACPHANPQDGKLAVTLINSCKKSKIIPIFPRFVKGKHKNISLITSVSADYINISAPEEKNFSVDIDGEIYSDIKFDCKPLKGIMNVVLPID